MKLKIAIFMTAFMNVLSVSFLGATTLTNLSGTDLKVKVTYVEQCLPDDPLLDPSESVFFLPNNTRTDISGSSPQNRQKGVCYKDITSIKAISVYTDANQNTTEIANTWYSHPKADFNAIRNITIRYSNGKMYLQ
jgi:hypothetical protein